MRCCWGIGAGAGWGPSVETPPDKGHKKYAKNAGRTEQEGLALTRV